jgi:chromate transporter
MLDTPGGKGYTVHTMNAKIHDCAVLFGVFFKIGTVAFGGGYAALPMLEHELIKKRAWTTQEMLYDYYAIGQCTPGIILVNVATFVGYTRSGILGSIAATAGIVTPSLIIISAIASFVQNFAHNPYVKKALAGINVSVAALLTKALADFGKKNITGILAFLLFFGSFAAMTFFKAGSAVIIFSGAAIGIIVKSIAAKSVMRKTAEKKPEGDDGTR